MTPHELMVAITELNKKSALIYKLRKLQQDKRQIEEQANTTFAVLVKAGVWVDKEVFTSQDIKRLVLLRYDQAITDADDACTMAGIKL